MSSNLQRQILYGISSVGRPKLEAARERLADLNPGVARRAPRAPAHQRRTRSRSSRRYDVVADGTDNFPTRYLVNDACVLLGQAQRLRQHLPLRGPGERVRCARAGPCYRCLYPEPPPPGLVPSCAEGGVLGVLPG